MQAQASTDGLALAAWLNKLQEDSFSRASGVMRKAYPPERRVTGSQLAGNLGRRTYAFASSTRPDGRPVAAPTLFSVYARGVLAAHARRRGPARQRQVAPVARAVDPRGRA
jgi:hypothetical protein